MCEIRSLKMIDKRTVSYIDCLSYDCYTAYMTITITMTSKGQFTLPASVRKAMELRKRGDKLTLEFQPASHQVVLSKPLSFKAIQAKARQYIKPGISPLTDADTLYNTREAKR
jgi:bifunctional DNA-binding transcriptional regulator/antitoxin component of YhaV-PrlF toxin-antitoxin module